MGWSENKTAQRARPTSCLVMKISAGGIEKFDVQFYFYFNLFKTLAQKLLSYICSNK